jgi:hypothetical protein
MENINLYYSDAVSSTVRAALKTRLHECASKGCNGTSSWVATITAQPSYLNDVCAAGGGQTIPTITTTAGGGSGGVTPSTTATGTATATTLSTSQPPAIVPVTTPTADDGGGGSGSGDVHKPSASKKNLPIPMIVQFSFSTELCTRTTSVNWVHVVAGCNPILCMNQ